MNTNKLSLMRVTQSVSLFCALILLSVTTSAHNKVVVIPMAGDDIAAPAHPVVDTFTNSVGMRFNKLPAGTFTMGSPTGEPGRYIEEVEHQVTLTEAFNMQVTEVTNAQWDAVIVDSFLGSNPSASNTGDEYPVDTVSWFDAVFFANRLSVVEGRSLCYSVTGQSGTPGTSVFSMSSVTNVPNCTGYRLPTEAEWEYAARANTTNAYANPINFDSSDIEISSGLNGNLHAMGWYSYNNTLSYPTGTKPTAKKQANAWGLYDMHGNVWEWNQDWYTAYSGNVTDPTGPASGSDRVIRGGSWDFNAGDARSASRINTTPGNRGGNVGFRLVLP